jgi:signal transduction histidine kinase
MDDKIELKVLKQVSQQADDLFFVFNIQTKQIEFANAAFKHILKRNLLDFESSPRELYQLIYPEDLDYVRLALKEMLETKKQATLDFRILWPDKTDRWMRLKIYPIVEGQEVQYVVGWMEDDSARKKALFNMEKITSWKDTVLEVIAHDLRGPIGVIQMFASVIERKLPEDEYKDLHKIASSISLICNRNIELINSLLKKELLDTEAVELSLERLDVIWEIEQVVRIYHQTREHTGKEIRFTHSHEAIYAMLDSAKFLQVVNNLVSNAMKFTPEGGLIKVHAEKLEDSFLITVADTGIGIHQVFESQAAWPQWRGAGWFRHVDCQIGGRTTPRKGLV